MMTTYPTVERLFEATKIDEAVKWLRQHAGPLIAEVGDPMKHRLLRGSHSHAAKTFIELPVRSDRRTRMMGAERTALVNGLIKDAGLVANRINSVFTTGDVEAGKQWMPKSAMPFVVVPKGPFNYTWMPDVDDLNMWIMYNAHLFRHEDEQYASPPHMQRVNDAIGDLKFKGDDHSLVEAIQHKDKCEIMIHPHSNTIGLFNYDVFSVAMGMLQDS